MTPARLQPGLIPALLVRDMAEALAFYRRLGFSVTGIHPSEADPSWAEVTRDGIRLQFHTEPPVGTPDEPVMSGTLYIFVNDVAVLVEEFRAAGIAFAWEPEEMPYGLFEFGVQDPNGYYLAFAQPV